MALGYAFGKAQQEVIDALTGAVLVDRMMLYARRVGLQWLFFP
jgi:hypothetical protein